MAATPEDSDQRQPPGSGSLDNEVNRFCFMEWMDLQEREVADLTQAQIMLDHTPSTLDLYDQLTRGCIERFENYTRDRSYRAHSDPFYLVHVPGKLPPLGRRVQAVDVYKVRLIYGLSGSDVNSSLPQSLIGSLDVPGTSSSSGNRTRLSGLSHEQFEAINALQLRTIKEEERITSRLASLQEDIADYPIGMITQRVLGSTSEASESEGDAERALNEHEMAMVDVLEAADRLWLNTVRELVSILSTGQAVDFLAAGKKLHLSIHQWGKRRDHMHGRD